MMGICLSLTCFSQQSGDSAVVVEDFEGTSALAWLGPAAVPGAHSAVLVSEGKVGGKAMKLELTKYSGWADLHCRKIKDAIPKMIERKCNAMTIWIKGDGQKPDLTFYLNEDNGERWGMKIDYPADTEWHRVALKFDDAQLVAPQSSKDNKILDLSKVDMMGFITGGNPKFFLIDHIQAERIE